MPHPRVVSSSATIASRDGNVNHPIFVKFRFLQKMRKEIDVFPGEFSHHNLFSGNKGGNRPWVGLRHRGGIRYFILSPGLDDISGIITTPHTPRFGYSIA